MRGTDQGKLRWSLAWSLGLVLAQPVGAQSPSTLNDLIQSIKTQREAALNPTAAPPANQRDLQRKTTPEPEALPLVWSITGMNGHYSAILVHERKAHVIHSVDLPQKLGNWRVSSINEGSVWLQRSGRKISLRAPDNTTRVEPFLAALSSSAEHEDHEPHSRDYTPPPGRPEPPGAPMRSRALTHPLPPGMSAERLNRTPRPASSDLTGAP